MASIFEVIEGLTVTRDDIVEAELFTEQYLSAQFPTYDFRQGTALRDMTVRPNATLLALVNKAIQKYFDDTDIINITNDTDKEAVDNKLSNFFITRKTGDKSVISARLFFTFPIGKPMTTIIPVSAYFSVDNDIKYYPRGNISVYAEETPDEYYFRFDNSSNRWYVDIELESEGTSEESNIETGDLLYFTIFSPYFIQAQVQYLVSKAIPEETNEQMVERSYSAISTRNLINTPSIISRISDQFNYVKSVYPVGLGDEWLYRDLIDIINVEDGNSINTYHRGGHVDVYVETDTIEQTAQLTAVEDPDSPGDTCFFVSGPIYQVVRAESAPSGEDPDTMPLYQVTGDPLSGFVPFTYSAYNVSEYDANSIPLTPEEDIGLSADQVIKISPGITLNVGDTATFTFSVFQGVGSIDDSIKSEEERVVCADYLVRSFEPIFIDINIDTRGEAVEDEALTYESLLEYVDGIPNGGTLYVSEMINTIIDSGIRDFKLPITVTSNRFPRKTEGDETGSTVTVTGSIVDTASALPVQKFCLRYVTYQEV